MFKANSVSRNGKRVERRTEYVFTSLKMNISSLRTAKKESLSTLLDHKNGSFEEKFGKTREKIGTCMRLLGEKLVKDRNGS